MVFCARRFEFKFPRPALVMGVVNVTPDSFSDGGKFFDAAAAVAHGMALAMEGASIIDVGGESTRPGATPVSETEELRRVIPVITELAKQLNVPISIDTMKPAVARAAVAAGASIINDVAANREDDAMWRFVAESGAGYVAMHMQGKPETMQVSPKYDDVTGEVKEFFAERLERLERAGVKAKQVVLDVGIGFGKTLEHNLQLLTGLGSFTSLGRPLMIGVSRKSFLGKMAKMTDTDSDPLTVAGAFTMIAAQAGVQFFRTHDVAATVRTLRMTEVYLAMKK
jgi:dihydropteroate synthase